MQIASHNTMTYLQPKHWWMKPFAFMARCQSRDIVEQFVDHNVRLFDLRVRFDKQGKPTFAHGMMTYRYDPLMAICRICMLAEEYRERTYLMMSLECTSKKEIEYQQELFRRFVNNVKLRIRNYYRTYPMLCGGGRKLDWHKVEGVDLPAPPTYTQMVASTTWKIWDDWFPWLYARIMNRKNRKKQYDTGFVSFDFVQIK